MQKTVYVKGQVTIRGYFGKELVAEQPTTEELLEQANTLGGALYKELCLLTGYLDRVHSFHSDAAVTLDASEYINEEFGIDVDNPVDILEKLHSYVAQKRVMLENSRVFGQHS